MNNKRNTVPSSPSSKRILLLALLLPLLYPYAAAEVLAQGDGQEHKQGTDAFSMASYDQRRFLRSRPDQLQENYQASSFQAKTSKEKKIKDYGNEEAVSDASASSSSMYNYKGIAPRAFEPWPSDRALPCVPSEYNWMDQDIQNSPSREGFLYSSLYKTGSSTLSGINLRIARNVANRTSGIATTTTGMCKGRHTHNNIHDPIRPPAIRFQNRDKTKSFLWSVVREPTHRLISTFFHREVSRKKKSPMDQNFRNFLLGENTEVQPYYLNSLYPYFEEATDLDPVTLANLIMQEYDFIGVTERMDEVAVLIMMLLNLPMADILFLNVKHHAWDYRDTGGSTNNTCSYIFPSFVSKGMQAFFESDETWKERIKWDLAFYEAANRSMEMTIEKLGVKKFQANLEQFRHAQQVAAEQCMEATRFPCSEGGTKNKESDCLLNDSGCGAVCLDQVATTLDLLYHSQNPAES